MIGCELLCHLMCQAQLFWNQLVVELAGVIHLLSLQQLSFPT